MSPSGAENMSIIILADCSKTSLGRFIIPPCFIRAAKAPISIFNKFQYSLWLVNNVIIWIYYHKAMSFAIKFPGLPITSTAKWLQGGNESAIAKSLRKEILIDGLADLISHVASALYEFGLHAFHRLLCFQ
jgi:hypothetical protein